MAEDRHQSRENRATPLGTDLYEEARDHAIAAVEELLEERQAHHLLSQAAKEPAHDTLRGASLERQRLSETGTFHVGRIVHKTPYFNSYKVQLGANYGTLPCSALSHSSFVGLGPRSIDALTSGTGVLVHIPASFDHGYILGAIPLRHTDGRLVHPDRIQQGGGSGLHREDVHKQPILNTQGEGGVRDFSNNRPLDEAGVEWGWVTETGLGIIIDPFQAMLRVSEICGLFLNYFDHYARLAGYNFDLQTAPFQGRFRDDEGEHLYIGEHYVYPWEALGLFTPGTDIAQTYDARAVQDELFRANRDLVEGQEDTQPFARVQHYGGYLGQGGRRLVAVPGRQEGVQRFADTAKEAGDVGVFEESIGLDGTYLLRSAKQIHIGKSVLIPVPKRRRTPEDAAAGDDARGREPSDPGGDPRPNYRHSGLFGEDAPAHKVSELAPPESDAGSFGRLSALPDVLSYNYNWRAQHPFHYHERDYDLPEESELAEQGPFERRQDPLSFSELAGRANMSQPGARTAPVDHRYGSTAYFQRESYISFLPDGGVAIGDGYGAQITMAAGHIRLEAPGDVQALPGRNFVSLGHDVVLRAHDSLDATAGNGDLRLKSERNLQVLAGNSGTGGLLFESRSFGRGQSFDNRVGEEVAGTGIVFKAPESGVDIWSRDIYLRTGGEGLGLGQIVIDSGQGRGQLSLQGQDVNIFGDRSATISIGPDVESSDVSAVYQFTVSDAIFGGRLSASGGGFFGGPGVFGGNLAADGLIGSSAGQFAVAEFEGEILASLRDTIQGVRDSATDAADASSEAHTGVFSEFIYAEQGPGNGDTIRRTEFSLRDDTDGRQYGVQEFAMLEPRWVRMVRLEGAEGGSSWDEPSVRYQGRDLLPWPGRGRWEDDATLQRAKEMPLTEPEYAADRGKIYEDAESGELETVPPASGYRVILP